MPADWLTDDQEREPVAAYVFGLLRQVGREPTRQALLRSAARGFGATLQAFLRSQERRP